MRNRLPLPLPVAGRFLAFLQQYHNDRGALANLRGALSNTRQARAWPLLGGFKGDDAIGNALYTTVAALWAHAPEQAAMAGNLGDTLGALKQKLSSFDGRFKRLLTCDCDEIAERVAPIVRAAQVQGMRVNYTQLLSDLLCWGDAVRVAWAKAFWGTHEADDTRTLELQAAEEPGAGVDSFIATPAMAAEVAR